MTERTLATAGANAQLDIALLVEALHTRNSVGQKIAQIYKESIGIEILDARIRKGGNRTTHNDLEILIGPAPGIWVTVEHKSSKEYRPIKPDERPWDTGVQFHNGGCNLYSMAQLYAKAWYDTQIGSGALKEEWNITAPIPSYEEWFALDAKTQGEPKTPFGKELKEKVTAGGGSLRHKRPAAQAAFNPTPADMEILKKEVQEIINKVLGEKDYWLTIHGDLRGDFYCAWYPKFQIGEIEDVTMDREKDIFFNFRCGQNSFRAILRSG